MGLSGIVQECKNSFCVAYPRTVWFLLALLGVAASFPIVFFFGFAAKSVGNVTSLYYLLSAQAQTLATVFVLAFTFTLVAAQIASRYSQKLYDRILGLWALWYAIPYAIGILLPLLLLNGNFYLWAARASLFIMVYCIVSLLPFAVAVRGLLSPSGAMSEKKQRILTRESDADIRQSIDELSDILVGALNLKDYESFRFGVGQLVEAANTHGVPGTLPPNVSSELQSIIVRYLDDRHASNVLLKAMHCVAFRQGMDATSQSNDSMLDQLAEVYRLIDISLIRAHDDEIDLIRAHAVAAIEGFRRTTASKCQTILHTIVDRAILEKNVDSQCASPALTALGDLAQNTMSSSMPWVDGEILVKSAIMRFETLGTMAVTAGKPEIRELARHQLRRIIANDSDNGRRIRNIAAASLQMLNES